MKQYIIITPAYNESNYIKFPLSSVVVQSKLPFRWLIVDDGSTDDTVSVIDEYKKKYPWIDSHQRKKSDGQAYFASNVSAIMEGYKKLCDLQFEYVAILDADISLPENYYELILRKFKNDPQLGIASGIYENLIDNELRLVLSDRRSTPKAIMVFRREVFDQIGGFIPLPYGGEDTAACVMARMNEWKAWSFPNIKTIHHRPTGTGHSASIFKARFMQGICEHGLAIHPLFMLIKSIRRCVKEDPFLIGGLLRFAGFLYAYISRKKRYLTRDVIISTRKEQIYRILNGNKLPEGMAVNDTDDD